MMDYLDENVAHTIANVMTTVLKEIRERMGIVDDFESFAPELEKGLCDAIELHILTFGEDEFLRGEESAWADENE